MTLFFEDRVVDDLNPVLNFTRKEVESLLHFVEEEPGQISVTPPEDAEEVMHKACRLHPHLITKVQLLLLLLHRSVFASAEYEPFTSRVREANY